MSSQRPSTKRRAPLPQSDIASVGEMAQTAPVLSVPSAKLPRKKRKITNNLEEQAPQVSEHVTLLLNIVPRAMADLQNLELVIDAEKRLEMLNTVKELRTLFNNVSLDKKTSKIKAGVSSESSGGLNLVNLIALEHTFNGFCHPPSKTKSFGAICAYKSNVAALALKEDDEGETIVTPEQARTLSQKCVDRIYEDADQFARLTDQTKAKSKAEPARRNPETQAKSQSRRLHVPGPVLQLMVRLQDAVINSIMPNDMEASEARLPFVVKSEDLQAGYDFEGKVPEPGAASRGGGDAAPAVEASSDSESREVATGRDEEGPAEHGSGEIFPRRNEETALLAEGSAIGAVSLGVSYWKADATWAKHREGSGNFFYSKDGVICKVSKLQRDLYQNDPTAAYKNMEVNPDLFSILSVPRNEAHWTKVIADRQGLLGGRSLGFAKGHLMPSRVILHPVGFVTPRGGTDAHALYRTAAMLQTDAALVVDIVEAIARGRWNASQEWHSAREESRLDFEELARDPGGLNISAAAAPIPSLMIRRENGLIEEAIDDASGDGVREFIRICAEQPTYTRVNSVIQSLITQFAQQKDGRHGLMRCVIDKPWRTILKSLAQSLSVLLLFVKGLLELERIGVVHNEAALENFVVSSLSEKQPHDVDVHKSQADSFSMVFGSSAHQLQMHASRRQGHTGKVRGAFVDFSEARLGQNFYRHPSTRPTLDTAERVSNIAPCRSLGPCTCASCDIPCLMPLAIRKYASPEALGFRAEGRPGDSFRVRSSTDVYGVGLAVLEALSTNFALPRCITVVSKKNSSKDFYPIGTLPTTTHGEPSRFSVHITSRRAVGRSVRACLKANLKAIKFQHVSHLNCFKDDQATVSHLFRNKNKAREADKTALDSCRRLATVMGDVSRRPNNKVLILDKKDSAGGAHSMYGQLILGFNAMVDTEELLTFYAPVFERLGMGKSSAGQCTVLAGHIEGEPDKPKGVVKQRYFNPLLFADVYATISGLELSPELLLSLAAGSKKVAKSIGRVRPLIYDMTEIIEECCVIDEARRPSLTYLHKKIEDCLGTVSECLVECET